MPDYQGSFSCHLCSVGDSRSTVVLHFHPPTGPHPTKCRSADHCLQVAAGEARAASTLLDQSQRAVVSTPEKYHQLALLLFQES